MPANSSANVLRRKTHGKKHFTVPEANRALTYVSRVVDDVQRLYQDALSVQHRVEYPQPGDDARELQGEYARLVDRLNECVAELDLVGVEVKDYETGLVDFPASHEGRDIYLCWKPGEAQIAAWHDAESGYADRQDVTLLESEDDEESA
jgi:hypothetical protein